jgi:hypothetical protein
VETRPRLQPERHELRGQSDGDERKKLSRRSEIFSINGINRATGRYKSRNRKHVLCRKRFQSLFRNARNKRTRDGDGAVAAGLVLSRRTRRLQGKAMSRHLDSGTH